MHLHCSHMFLTSQVDDYTEVGLVDRTLVVSLFMTTRVFNHAKGPHSYVNVFAITSNEPILL